MGEKICKPICMCLQKVTVMELKVNLQCSKCCTKVKKVLCKFPQIQDQVYDEKNSKVIIKVVCCNPEKIRDKLCCKGDGAIKSIEILEPEKQKEKSPPPPPTEDQREATKQTPPKENLQPPPPSSDDKPVKTKPPKQTPQPTPTPTPCHPPVRVCCQECYEGRGGGQCYHPTPNTVRDCCWECYDGSGVGPCYQPAPRVCCRECYEGRSGGPCYQPAPRVCCRECYEGRTGGSCYYLAYGRMRYYDGYCGRPVYDSWGGGRIRCTDYICEDNTAGCTIV